MSLEDRLQLREVYLHPPQEPLYINDGKNGKVTIKARVFEGPATAPKRNEFSRYGVAKARGGIFPRGVGGCVPFVP
jgi:hypothetical protein